MKTTKDIKVPAKLIDQVIGQDHAVNIIRKAALQRRHVLLIGEPGTGKSLLGMGLAELIPQSELKDILALPNVNDENNPLITEVPAGKGREEVKKYSLDARQVMKNNNFLLFLVAIITLIAPWWVRHYYKSDIMFAAFFLGGMVFLGAFSIMMSMGPRMFRNEHHTTPKLIVDNFSKKQGPFFDATGAHAGALLGDVLHDPFQTFFTGQELQVITANKVKKRKINDEIDTIMNKYKERILQKKENNYEAVFLPKNELSIFGETNGSISPVEVLSCNRYNYIGDMIKLTTSENKELIVTPEHKIATWSDGSIDYVEAQNMKAGDDIVAQPEVILTKEDIIATYDAPQQKQSQWYYQYLNVKATHPSWGYKRIAKSLGLEYHKTRWWHAKKYIPVPVQTVEWLIKRGLLPLKIYHPQLPLMAKVLGATFGDGGIFENLNGIFLSSSEKEAVEEFGRDLEQLFQLSSQENSRIIEGGVYGHSWCHQNTNRNIIRFFIALGAPRGNKTKLPLEAPSWIKLKEEWEDAFYGSFFGGELGTPIMHKRGNFLTSLEVSITGTPKFKENRKAFLKEVESYLKRKRVCTTSIYEGKYKTPDSTIFRLLIEKKFDNVLFFLCNIKLNYCIYKNTRLYQALGQWAMVKKKKYNELLERGYGAEHAMKVLNLTPNSLYLLLNHFGPAHGATL